MAKPVSPKLGVTDSMGVADNMGVTDTMGINILSSNFSSETNLLSNQSTQEPAQTAPSDPPADTFMMGNSSADNEFKPL